MTLDLQIHFSLYDFSPFFSPQPLHLLHKEALRIATNWKYFVPSAAHQCVLGEISDLISVEEGAKGRSEFPKSQRLSKCCLNVSSHHAWSCLQSHCFCYTWWHFLQDLQGKTGLQPRPEEATECQEELSREQTLMASFGLILTFSKTLLDIKGMFLFKWW